MGNKEDWASLKRRIEADPNHKRCGRCGEWLLPGGTGILCGRCAKDVDNLDIGYSGCVLLSLLLFVIAAGVVWMFLMILFALTKGHSN